MIIKSLAKDGGQLLNKINSISESKFSSVITRIQAGSQAFQDTLRGMVAQLTRLSAEVAKLKK